MTVRRLHPSLLSYDPGFLSVSEQADLTKFLDCVPVIAPSDRDSRLVSNAFAFTSPQVGGVIVSGRGEAAAGYPVWGGDSPTRGVEIPGPLRALADRVDRHLADDVGLCTVAGVGQRSFSSVYVDRYPAGGSFFPHTDRDCYGPVVAGVSVGMGSCRITFEADGAVQVSCILEPGSLYVFAGHLRYAPCTHRISDVSDWRFGVTFRSPADALEAGGPG